MKDTLETIKVLSLNAFTFATVSLADIEVLMRIVLLTLSIAYTVWKFFQGLKKDA